MSLQMNQECKICNHGLQLYNIPSISKAKIETFGCVKSLSVVKKKSKNSSFINQSHPFSNCSIFDRRVVCENTFKSASIFTRPQTQLYRYTEGKKKQLLKKEYRLQASKLMTMRISTPSPIPEKEHELIQTDLYQEKLFEKFGESEAATQTDYFIRGPLILPILFEKTGIDVETQIDASDLFDYNIEVQPIVEALVSGTIEQALSEVLEEEGIATIEEQQKRFLELKKTREFETLMLEEQERKLGEENTQCLRQHKETLKAQRETEKRVAAAVLLTGYIAELLPSILEESKVSGCLMDEIKSIKTDGSMSWLVKEIRNEIDYVMNDRESLSDII